MRSDDELPPPMPAPRQGTDRQTFAARPPSAGLSIRSDLDDELAEPTATGAKVNLRAIEDAEPPLSGTGQRALTQGNLERRIPVARGQRPTLLPAGIEEPPKLPGAVRVVDPALVRPVRSAPELLRPAVGDSDRKSSDVIQMFASAGSSPSVPLPLQVQGPRGTLPPPHKLLRRAPVPAAPVARTVAPPAGVLPLQADRMALLIAEHRARLRNLDQLARGLEVGAGVLAMFGLVGLATAFAAVVSGHGISVLASLTAFIAGAISMGIAGLLLALATVLRHQAHSGAQVAALLEALSRQPR